MNSFSKCAQQATAPTDPDVTSRPTGTRPGAARDETGDRTG